MLRSALGGLSISDQTILDIPGEMEIMIESVRECMLRGGAGATDDVRAVVLDWDFKLEDIQTKVFIWQGEDDPQVTPAMASYMSDRIPNNDCTLVSGAGHLLIISHWRDIMEQLLDHWGND